MRALTVLLAVLAFLLAACGGDSDEEVADQIAEQNGAVIEGVGVAALLISQPATADASEKRHCGTVPGAIALYDVRTKQNVDCRTARKTGKLWLKKVVSGKCTRFDCKVRRFRCRAKPPAEVSYVVKCKRKAGGRVLWNISVD